MLITLLGPFELRTDDDRLVPVATRKRREVLAALALELNRVVPTETLLTAVWGEDPPPAARSALQGHIAQLRKDLDEDMRLVTRPPGYVLLAAEDAIDVHRFNNLVRQGMTAGRRAAIELLGSALDMWQGPALSGLGGERLGEWAAGLHDTRLNALEALGDHLVALGRGVERLADLREAAREQPFRESLVRLLMMALYQDGQQAEALAVYHRTRAALAEELGVDPGPVLRSAYESILRGEARACPERAPAVAVTSTAERALTQLPAPPRGFAGRTAELAALDSAGELVLLTGPAGVGKTALALHWAQRPDCPDGALFADLRGFSASEPADPADILARFLIALGAEVPDGLEARAAAYRSALAGRRMLVVLDNAASAEQVRPLLPRAGVRTVVTSRYRLDSLVVGEGAAPLPVGPLPATDAIALLAALAGTHRLDREPDAVRRLLAACDGLPLALRIAAARLATRPNDPVSALADRLADESTRLSLLRTDDQATGVAAALTLTNRHLPDAPAHLLRCFGRHGATTITLTEGTALTGLPAADVRQAFQTLEAFHLVTELPGDRYGITVLTHLYTRDLAARPPVANLAVRRFHLAGTVGEIPAQRTAGRRPKGQPAASAARS